jgi:predicted NUDIX family NTP pyrophosphohydrolase
VEIPEVDRAEWFNIETAREKIIGYQLPLIDELVKKMPDV